MNFPLRVSAALLAVAAAGSLTACAMTDARAVPAGPASVEPPAQQLFLSDCGADLVTTPGTVTVTCADAAQTLQGLVWSNWGAAEATATGTEVVNMCEPSCAAGKVVSFPVTVTASAPVAGTTVTAYTKLTITAQGATPSGIDAVETVDLTGWDKLGTPATPTK